MLISSFHERQTRNNEKIKQLLNFGNGANLLI